MKKNPNAILFFLSCILILVVSCTESESIYSYKQIDGEKWFRDSVLTYIIDSVQLNAAKSYNLSFEITTGRNYPYRDIWIEVTHNLNDSVCQVDSLQFILADKNGKWFGSGVGGLNQITFPYLSYLSLDTAQLYEMKIRHTMIDNPLGGVVKVGIKLW